jgi:hypothetical protein
MVAIGPSIWGRIASRQIGETDSMAGIVVEVDFVAAAVGAAQNCEHVIPQ